MCHKLSRTVLVGLCFAVLGVSMSNPALAETWTNSLGMEFVWVPAGEFVMGSTSRIAGDDEGPVTRVRISEGFYLGTCEVTQGEWEAVMGENPSLFQDCGADCPVERVSWLDVQEFIAKLNERERGNGYAYRLPSEAEWEYAARAGSRGDTYGGDISEPNGRDPVLERTAWYVANSGGGTHPVGGKRANSWGLHDILGNVWEWVGDWYGGYPGGSVTDPTGPRTGSARVARGGSWDSYARFCRVANRPDVPPDTRSISLGFRLARTK